MIYLVRHGEAAAGWGDHPDPGLSALGMEQAKRVASTLVECGATSVVSSPMQRCRETAIPFADLIDFRPRIEPAVSEIATPDHITDRVSWLRSLVKGEWPAQMLPWCRQVLAAVAALPDGTVVFSHFVAINAIVGQITEKKSVLVFKPGHCSVTVLGRDAQGELTLESRGHEAITKVI